MHSIECYAHSDFMLIKKSLYIGTNIKADMAKKKYVQENKKQVS